METNDPIVPDTAAMVRADDIPWTFQPVRRKEDDNPVDVYALDHDALLTYAYGLRDDLRGVRRLLYVALEALAKVTKTVERLLRENRWLREEIRTLRGRS